MTTKRISSLCETIGTMFWLLMDFCWMSDYKVIASISAALACCFLLCAFIFYKSSKWNDFLSYVASFFWCLMNSYWMLSDFLKDESLLVTSKCIFVFTVILSLIILYLNKRENKEVNFTRFKIK